MISANVASVCILPIWTGSRIGKPYKSRATYCESFSKSVKPGQFKFVEILKYKPRISNDALSIWSNQRYTAKHRLPMFARSSMDLHSRVVFGIRIKEVNTCRKYVGVHNGEHIIYTCLCVQRLILPFLVFLQEFFFLKGKYKTVNSNSFKRTFWIIQKFVNDEQNFQLKYLKNSRLFFSPPLLSTTNYADTKWLTYA